MTKFPSLKRNQPVQKNLPKSNLNRMLTRDSFKHHAGQMSVPFDNSWTGTVSTLLLAYALTPMGRLDLTLRTPHIIPERISAKLCLFIFERIRTYSEVQGLHSDLLYWELRKLIKDPTLCSQKFLELHKNLTDLKDFQYFENFSKNQDSPVLAILACCSWWNYSAGAYRALVSLKAGLPDEVWECWVDDCLKKLQNLVSEDLLKVTGI